MDTGAGTEVSTTTIQHGQLSSSPVGTQQPPRSVTSEAAADQAGVRTPTWPASPPPSGYATPAVAVTGLAADAQLHSQGSPGSQASQASHAAGISIVRATLTIPGSSHSLSTWPDAAHVNACLPQSSLNALPNELLLHILGYLDVCDLLATSRVSDTRLRPAYNTAPVSSSLPRETPLFPHRTLFFQLLTQEFSHCRQITSSAPYLSHQFSTSTDCSVHASSCPLYCHPLTALHYQTSSPAASSSQAPRLSRASLHVPSCRSASHAALPPAHHPKPSSNAASCRPNASPV